MAMAKNYCYYCQNYFAIIQSAQVDRFGKEITLIELACNHILATTKYK